MVKIDKHNFLEPLMDYYYDHIWAPRSTNSDPRPMEFDDWLLNTYNAIHSRFDPYIRFDKAEDATMFILKWQ